MTIIFYDLITNVPQKALSCNTWKARFALNYKGIPYKTEWVEWKDVDSHCKKLGIKPTKTWPSGRPYYTIPAIHDLDTGAYVAESFAIAEYLEKTYPKSGRSLFPGNTVALQSTVEDVLNNAVLKHMAPFITADVIHRLDASADYWRRSREELYGIAYDDIAPKGSAADKAWADAEAGWGMINDMIAKSGGPFILGETPSWGDFVLASWLIFGEQVWGKDSKRWKDVASWQNGRWAKLLEDLKEYQRID